MIVEHDAYWSQVLNVVVILFCVLEITIVTLFKDKIPNIRIRHCVAEGSLIVVSFVIVILIVLPWMLSVVGYGEPWFDLILIILSMVCVFGIWILFCWWFGYVEGLVKDEVSRERSMQQEDVDKMGAMMDEKSTKIAQDQKACLKEHHNRNDARLNQHTESVSNFMKTSTNEIKEGIKSLEEKEQKREAILADTRSAVKRMADAANERDEKMKFARIRIKKIESRMDELKDILEEIRTKTDEIPGLTSGVGTLKSQMAGMGAGIAAVVEVTSPDCPAAEVTAKDGGIQPVEFQNLEQICSYLEKCGFVCVRGKNRADPDILLYDKNGKKIAVVCVRYRAITDDVHNRTKRIGRKMCAVGLKHAELYGIPLMLVVINTTNGRKWMCIVKPEDLEGWPGVTTPDILAKDDETSKNTLEGRYRDEIIKIGGMA